MPISASDLAKLRGSSQLARPIFNVIPPRTVATARINQSSFPAALGELTVDNTPAEWTDIQTGQMVWVGRSAGAYDVLVATVRLAPTATTLYIDGISPGAAGTARRINYALADDQYVTIIDHDPIWAQLSRIFNRTFFKRFNVAYDGSGSNPNPVANLGAWQRKDAGTSGTVTFSLDASDSVAWGSKTITGYLWSLPSGVTLTDGYSLTDAAIEVTATPGWHHVGCTVTDSGSATHAGYTVLCANGTGFTALSDSYACVIESDHQDLKGREMTVRVWGDLPESIFFPGAVVLYTEEALFNGATVSDGVVVDTFVGYVVGEPATGSYRGKSLTLTLRSPYMLLQDVPMVSQAITEKASPNRWDEIGLGYGTPDVVLWYVLHHHCPNILKWFDFHALPEASPPRKKRWGLNGSHIQEYCEQVAESVGGNIGSASDGSLYFFRDPTLESVAFRTALDHRLTYGDNDILGELSYGLDYRLKVGQFTAYAFAYSGSTPVPLGSIAPGIIQSQGIGREEIQSFIVTNQSELNTKSAQLFQRANTDLPQFGFKMNRNMDIADPARHFNTWFYFDFSSDINPRGTDVDGRGLVESVDRTWVETDTGELVKETVQNLRPETYNETPGQTIPIQRGEGGLTNPEYETSPPEAYNPLTKFLGFAAAWNEEGVLARTFNLLDSNGSTWQDITPAAMEGNVNDLHLDWWSSLPRSGWLEGKMGAYMVSTSSTTLSIWYADDLLAADVTWTLLNVYTMNDNSVTTAARVQVSKSEEDFVAVAWKDQTGTLVGRSTDGGATWATAERAGNGVNDANNDNADIGFAIDGVNQLVTAPDSSVEYGIYLATTTGGAFSALANTTRSKVPQSSITPNADGDAWVSDQGVSGEDYTVTFDPGGYTTYDPASGGVYWLRSNPDLGSPHNIVFRITKTYSTNIGTEAFYVKMYSQNPSAYPFTVSFDYRAFWPSGTNPLVWHRFEVTQSTTPAIYIFRDDITQDEAAKNDVWQSSGDIAIPNGGGFVYFRMTAGNSSSWTVGSYMEIDNLRIVESSGAAALYRVDTYAGTDAWDNQTPGTDHAPAYPYGVGVDLVSASNIDTLAADDTDTRWYQSTDEGDTWSDKSTSSYRGVKRAGNYIILFGEDALGYSDDAGATVTSILGDWATTIGTVGLIRGVVTIV